MTLKECTKEELIYIIERLTWLEKSHLRTIIHEVEYNRVKKKLAEAERWSEIAGEHRDKYIELMKKHAGQKLTDIPIQDIKEMEKCLKKAEEADKKYDKLINEVNAYGK